MSDQESEIATPDVFTKQTQKLIGGIQAKPLKEREPEYQKAMAKVLPFQVQAGVDVEREKIARDVDVKESSAKEGQRLSEVQRMEQKGFAEKLDKYAPPTFQPSQEDLTTYAQLGSSIVTLGMMLGGGGKVPAKAALASMTGMLNGWRTGRKELYERESKNFEKESQRLTAVRKSIQDDMNQAMSLYPTRRKDAIALIESARYKAGSESVLGAMLYKGNYDGAMKLLESASKLDAVRLASEQKIEAEKLKANAADRRQRETMAQRERLAKTKGAGKGLSQQQQGFEDMVSISINEAAAQVENLATMKFATTGFWQGRNTKGLFDAPLGVLANTLTTEDVQRYNAVIGVLGREAAKVFAGGRIITDKAADQMSDQFKIKGGDKPFTVLEKMANIRQFFERAITVKQARQDVSPGMKEIYLNALTSFAEAIPITNKEVNEAKRQFDASKGKSTKTFGEIIKEMGSAKPAAAAPASPAAPVAAAPTIDKADLRSKAAARIAAGANKDTVAKKYKEITGEDY